jgi:hypothetical protein
MNVAEHFRALDINNEESAVKLLTMGRYPDVYKDPDYIADFMDEDYVDWYLENTEDEYVLIYDEWPKLLSLCADLIQEFAEQEYLGPTTNAMIMDCAMKRLRKLHGLNAPEPWLPIICELRRVRFPDGITFSPLRCGRVP